MSDPDWRTDTVSDRIRDFCITNPTNCGNAAISTMLLKEFRVVVSKNQVAGALSRMKVSRGGYSKPTTTRGAEEIAWTNPRLPEMLTPHSRSRENGIVGNLVKYGRLAVRKPPQPVKAPLPVRLQAIVEKPPAPAPVVRTPLPVRMPPELVGDMGSPPREFCCFPLWSDTERPTHRYCCEPVVYRMRDGERVLSSYCGQHQAACHIHMRSWAA